MNLLSLWKSIVREPKLLVCLPPIGFNPWLPFKPWIGPTRSKRFGIVRKGTLELQKETAPSTPATGYGRLYYDTTLLRTMFLDEFGQKVSLPGVMGVTSASAASTTTAETKSLIGTIVGTFTVSATEMLVGKTFRLNTWGFITTGGTAGTITFFSKLGGVTIGTTGALAPTINMSSRPWHHEIIFTVRAVGSGTSCNVFAQGYFEYDATTPSSATTSRISWQMGTAAVSSGLDSTASNLVDFQSTTSNNGHTITCSNAMLEMLF